MSSTEKEEEEKEEEKQGEHGPPEGSPAAFVVWFTGLPGSGKTTISRGVYERMRAVNPELKLRIISMDSIRGKLTPNPKYSDEERDFAYRAFVLLASFLSGSGINVILDGVGHKLEWRKLARAECANFVEVYVRCPIDVCIERETRRTDGIRRQLYLSALDRLRTGNKSDNLLGKVPGVDEPFEESEHPEIVLDSSSRSPEELIKIAIGGLKALGLRAIFSSFPEDST